MVYYKAEHRRYLDMAAALESRLPSDIVLKNVLPFLAYTLKEEDEKERMARRKKTLAMVVISQE